MADPLAPEERVLVAEVAADVVAAVAPEEVVVLDAVREVYLRGGSDALADARGDDDLLGFGLGGAELLIAPIAFDVMGDVAKYLYGVVKDSLKKESGEAIEQGVRRLFKRFRSEDPQEEPAAHLGDEELRRVRDIVTERAGRLGLSDDRAELLADSVVGALVVG